MQEFNINQTLQFMIEEGIQINWNDYKWEISKTNTFYSWQGFLQQQVEER